MRMRRGGHATTRGAVLAQVLAALAVASGALVVVIGLTLAWYWRDLPPLTKVTDYQPREHLQVLTATGEEIAGFGSERRIFVPIDQMPPLLQDALLAIEDTQFREHFGISLKGLLRATVANLTGGMPQGASTITQQVARTFFLSTRRTPERKIKEALLALQIEQQLSKDQILELYMNQIYLGQRAYGFGAAAQVYFGKPLAALSLAESAMLAGLPQNPMWANPVVNANRARRRQLLVLHRMRDIGRITEAEHDAAVAEQLVLRRTRPTEMHAEYVAEMARQTVVQRFGEKAYTQGLRVITSIRPAEQQAAHQALRQAVLAHERKQRWRGPEDHEDLPERLQGAELERAAAQALKDHRDDDDLRVAIVLAASPTEVQAQLVTGEVVHVQRAGLRQAAPGLRPQAEAALAVRRGSVIRVMAETVRKGVEWRIVQWPQADGAFVALDPATGRVRALVGGFDFNRRQFNHVTSAWRQPGSSFKPFLYASAFEHGVMPETVVDDLPLTPEEGATDDWNPKNSDGQFDGPISVREALVRSKNLVSLRLLRQVGLAAVRETIARFGFDPRKHPDNLTLALGAGSVTPLQMATAYGVFANGGWKVDPVLIERIVDARGRVLFEAPPPPPLYDDQRVLPEANLFLVRSLLSDVTLRGTAARAKARLHRADLYGKTGTTNDAVDAWFAGFQPGVVAVSWIGYDDPQSLGVSESGGGLALPAWIDFMAKALAGVPVVPLQVPPGVERSDTDWRLTGDPSQPFVTRIRSPDSDDDRDGEDIERDTATDGSHAGITGSSDKLPAGAADSGSTRVQTPTAAAQVDRGLDRLRSSTTATGSGGAQPLGSPGSTRVSSPLGVGSGLR
jgi:penicillin-binding protein 1A